MNTPFSYTLLLFLGFGILFSSCSDPKSNDYSAYFGGEIINPKDTWVFFYKGEELLDSIALNQDNRFLKRFDSLPVGLYSFKHEAEYQYVYFDKNDSIMIRINTNDFDESLVFCGRGDEKNNFLVEMYLKNQKDRNLMFPTFDLEEDSFSKKADSSYQEILKFYTSKKEDINWDNHFDIIARASVDYPYYTKKEFYPVAHRRRTMKDIRQNLSPEFYNYRKKVDFNNDLLIDFWPYIQYINTTIDNIANSDNNGFLSDSQTTLRKIEIADTITNNQILKNKIANNIAFRYLMDKEENANDTIFLERYFEVSKDDDKKEKVKELVNSIRNLTSTGHLPTLTLKDLKNNLVSTDDLFERKTILYFWSTRNESHFFAVHRKLQMIIENHPNVDLIAVNLDEGYKDWIAFLEKNRRFVHPKIKHYQTSDFENLKEKWVVTRETRASIIDKNAQIIKGFTNIFESTFDKQL